MRANYTAKWGLQLAEMLFQIRSRIKFDFTRQETSTKFPATQKISHRNPFGKLWLMLYPLLFQNHIDDCIDSIRQYRVFAEIGECHGRIIAGTQLVETGISAPVAT